MSTERRRWRVGFAARVVLGRGGRRPADPDIEEGDLGEQDLRGVCEDCGRPFVISAAELRHRRRGRGDAPRLCSRCLIAAAHERRRPARVPVAAQSKAAPR